jgi:predicted nuclease with TOPRIM domain
MDTFFPPMICVDPQLSRIRADVPYEALPLRQRAFRAAIDHGGHDLAELEDRVTRVEAAFDRVLDRLDRIDARLAAMEARFDRIDARLAIIEADLAHLNGRVDQLPGHWTLLAVLLPISTGMFISLMGAAWALFHLTTP